MNEREFKKRTKQLALRVIRLIKALEALPYNLTAQIISKQLVRSATSVGANYRSACRAKSTADIIAKLSLVEEEADESLFWMELIVESGLLPQERLTELMSETNEILAMTVASIKTLRIKSQSPKSKI
jgi:four helix bundle protein